MIFLDFSGKSLILRGFLNRNYAREEILSETGIGKIGAPRHEEKGFRMIRKILTVDDVKVELERYFEVMRWLPDIKRPKCKTTNFYRVAVPPMNSEDAEFMRPNITGEDITDAWFIDEHWMSPPLILSNEYMFLRDFLSTLPKKELAYRYSPNKTDRKYVYRWAERLLKRIFEEVKNYY